MKYQDLHNTLYHMDFRKNDLPDESVQMVCTSPPYWGLRKYSGEQELIWGDNHCEHDFNIATPPRRSRTEDDCPNPNTISAGSKGSYYNAEGGNFCFLCGAWKGAYGLEPTPEMYVQHTIEILREIKRVLRKDGVVFWNIGDSYAGSGGDHKEGGKNDAGFQGDLMRGVSAKPVKSKRIERGSGRWGGGNMPASGVLKSKDLCLIPFRVAQEVQKPYYTGRIKNEKDRIWLAAMIDGEGCMFIHKRKVGQSNGQGYFRKQDTYGVGLEIANTNKDVIDNCLRITRMGSICHQDKARKQRLYRWNMRTNQCRDIIREIYPYLVGKKHEARIILGCPPSGEKAILAHRSLISLHNGKPSEIDFPEPVSMYELGWYVRSVIVWSKKNPMPESVTDRPTNSHEYILMLTKGAKYYWDADAVREPSDRVNSGGGHKWASIGHGGLEEWEPNPAGRNIRSVWEFPTQPYPEAHFAVFPEKLPEICIKAATPEVGCCSKCGSPWERITKKEYPQSRATKSTTPMEQNPQGYFSEKRYDDPIQIETLGWQPTCKCNADKVSSICLDPFAGIGTTLWVAKTLNRQAIGYEISEEYCNLIVERLRQQVFI